MSNEQLNILIDDYKTTGNEEIFKKILKEMEGIKNSIIKKYISFAEYMDLNQAADIGLLKALKYYDENKGRFSTLYYQLVLNEVGSTARKNKKHMYYKNKKIQALDCAVVATEEKTNFKDLLQAEDNIEEIIIKKYENEFILKCIQDYSKEYKKRYKTVKLVLRGMKYIDAGKVLGFSKVTIHNNFKHFINYCKEKTEKEFKIF